jgi:glycosyltransferase involved in cell wall biosynthesis
VSTLFLNPEMNAYWRDILENWKKWEPHLQVRTGTLTGTGQAWPTWVKQIGGGRRQNRPMYYGGLQQRHPTPFGPLLWEMLQLRPRHLVCYGFSGWTLLACLWRRLGLCRQLTLLWEGSSPGVDLRADRVRQKLRSWALRQADLAVTQSPQGEAYLKSLASPTPLSQVAWLFANPQRYQPRKEWAAGPLRLIYVGSLEERKGTDFLLEVLAELPGDWQLDLVGPWLMPSGPPTHPKIRLWGQCPPEQVQSLLAQSQLFLFPSREETWGVAPIEAACSGLAIFVSEFTPSRHLRPHWRSLPLSVNAWRQSLEDLIHHPEGLPALASESRASEERLYGQVKLPWD